MTETPDESTAGKLNYLRLRKVKDCSNCRLCETRTNTVFGEGSSTADVMFVGEGPGYNEDKSGRPFVGRAGKFLTNWIEAAGLKRSDCYITNVIKCRPPDNRDPEPDEIEACSKYLRIQIFLVQPKVIVALGRFAGNLLSGHTGDHPAISMKVLRTRPWLFHDEKTDVKIPVCPIYHPAWALRQGTNPHESEAYRVAVQDLQEALRVAESGELPEPLPDPDAEPEPAEPEPVADLMDLFGADED